jgi:hypothetical protein
MMKVSELSTIFAGFFSLGRCLSATYCTESYGFKRMKEEQGLLIQQKKVCMLQGLNPRLQGERPTPNDL